MLYIGLVVFSLIVGSFLNVVIYRLPERRSISYPPSHCLHCEHRLGVWDLIPVVSYLFLCGRCRYCSERISLRYPMVEGLTAITFLLVYLQYGYSLSTLAGWLLTSVLIACAFIDIDHGIIPDRITYPAFVAGLIFAWWTIGLQSSLVGAALFGGILLLAAVLSRGGMGGGDIKLAAVIGAFAGLPGAVVGLFVASVSGGLWAVVLLITGRAKRRTAIRFGPFLAIGGWVGGVYGGQLLNWYLNLLVNYKF
ncbi:MAG: prepilin peptidase [Methylocystaceae bacterium]